MRDPKDRFSDRVDDYERHRPGYPPVVLENLVRECGLAPQHVIADVGSGTGLLSGLLLRNGNRVYCVEPNAAMRAAAERKLCRYPNFISVNGSAEATTLPDSSVDFVTAGTSFHWFDQKLAHTEFARILRADGWLALLWNVRRMSGDAFHEAYEELVTQFGTDYRETKGLWHGVEKLRRFFLPGEMRRITLSNEQALDWESLRGRVLSASYAPRPDHPQYEPMVARLRRIFEESARDGCVTMKYDLEMYYGRLTA